MRTCSPAVRVAVAVAVMAGAAGVAGCGPRSGHAVRAAPSATSPAAPRPAAGSGPAARSALDDTAARLAGKRSADFTLTVNLAGHRSSQSGSCTWGAAGFRTDQVDHSPPAALRGFVREGAVETRQIGTALYYRVDPRSSGPLRGKHWVRIDLSAYTGATGVRLPADSTTDPVRQVRDLAAASDLRRVGVETVDGRRTTHYSGRVPATAEQKSEGLVESALVDVWLGDDGALVRYHHDVGGIEMTMDYPHFGEEPPIAVPPASDTADRTAAVRDALRKALRKA
jgi:hypothetical protein